MLVLLVAVLAVVAVIVVVNVRRAAYKQTASLGWMSEAWLARHRTSDFR